MQVRQQGWGIDRKLDQKIVTNEGLRGGNEATGYDPPLCRERVENRALLYLMDHAVIR